MVWSDSYSELFNGFRNDSVTMNFRVGTYYLRKIQRVAVSVYQWDGEGIDWNLMEEILWQDGHALIWRSEILGTVVTRCNEVGWDINGRPNRWRPVIIGGTSIPLPEMSAEECVPVYDLTDPRMKRRHCLSLLRDIVDISATERQQIRNQRTPLMVISSSVQKKNRDRVVTQAVLDSDVVFTDHDYGDEIKALDFNAPFNVEVLHQERKAVENEILEWLGVDSQAAFGKKERLIVNEQEDNDEVLNYILRDGLEPRLKAAERMKMFGINASVRVADTVRPHDRLNAGEDGRGAPGKEEI